METRHYNHVVNADLIRQPGELKKGKKAVFDTQYKVVLTLKSADETLVCDYSIERY